jgi:UDP-2-acetamido-3-amino-2,3-dideoxy-glucuronate N-acetyltransferase
MAAPFIHPMALVDTPNLGEDTRVWEFTHVLAGATIGRGCNICCHCFVENDVVIGDHVTLKSGVYVWDGLRIEDHVFVGPNVTFTNDRHPRSGQRPPEFLVTTLQHGCSIGGGAILLPGVTIGVGDARRGPLYAGGRLPGEVCELRVSLRPEGGNAGGRPRELFRGSLAPSGSPSPLGRGSLPRGVILPPPLGRSQG